jgi:hypothetical protein
MIEKFVEYHGKRTMKKLILDRGFLDGPNIVRCKQQWGIDVLIPARKGMDIYQDVMGLVPAGKIEFTPWSPPDLPPPVPVHRPERIKRRD